MHEVVLTVTFEELEAILWRRELGYNTTTSYSTYSGSGARDSFMASSTGAVAVNIAL
jgi:hypothetical protein